MCMGDMEKMAFTDGPSTSTKDGSGKSSTTGQDFRRRLQPADAEQEGDFGKTSTGGFSPSGGATAADMYVNDCMQTCMMEHGGHTTTGGHGMGDMSEEEMREYEEMNARM